jgi:hypothetical protein
VGHRPTHVTVQPEDHRVVGPADPCRVLRHRVHHRLQIGRRLADHAQDFARSRLLFQCFFRLVEQSGVLDGYYGLVGEGLEEVDLFVCEWLDL